MQSVNDRGILGPVEPFDQDRLEELLKDPNTNHVDVFPESEVPRRKKLKGKKYCVAKKYKKVPRVDKKKN